jgi:hypothetical protein
MLPTLMGWDDEAPAPAPATDGAAPDAASAPAQADALPAEPASAEP